VLRDGKRVSVDADQLVQGDLVFIKSGDKVPADLRLLQVTNLQVGAAAAAARAERAAKLSISEQKRTAVNRWIGCRCMRACRDILAMW
jgi:magnesium-transporting ATPase (P-type)